MAFVSGSATAIVARLTVVAGALALSGAAPAGRPPAQLAQELDALISHQYAYLDDLPGGALPQSAVLERLRREVQDERSLLAYAEIRLATLADHHAITGRSFRDSWSLVRSFTDL
ncbi:hypothetical protein [Sphingomicrobium arenosum]|uniref:hypothetical protein n=1 Tax=Sphingomicrobium arenosum TaxID=2233861 RepID=UPI0022406DA4|nr:hypothetical protein [Sphingomicrobium arenosum]